MKWMIASDIHGSALYCKKMFERFVEEQADRLLLLGDLLYHGPRNDLPEGYDPKAVIQMLNEHASELVCVRGNCEAEVDQMVLDFPVMAEYAIFQIPERDGILYVTHGHHASETTPPPLKKGDILLNGHTHIPACVDHGDFVYMNPGSVSIPKERSWRSYMIWEGETFTWKRLDDGAPYMEGTWVAEEVPEEVPAEVTEEVPVEAPEEVPVEVTEEVLEEAPEEVPVEVTEEIPVEAPEEVLSEVTEEDPVEVLEEVAEL